MHSRDSSSKKPSKRRAARRRAAEDAAIVDEVAQQVAEAAAASAGHPREVRRYKSMILFQLWARGYAGVRRPPLDEMWPSLAPPKTPAT